jgi:hypothetical protein
MSSPNTSLMSNYSTSPTSPSANALSAVSRDGRKRNGPIAPVYSPNETLNQMTQEVFIVFCKIFSLTKIYSFQKRPKLNNWKKVMYKEN